MTIDYKKAREILEEYFAEVEARYLQGEAPAGSSTIVKLFDVIFDSRTQAYREVLLGCTVIKILDKNINIRHPYSDQSANAFSGRTLDEKVINPFLQSKRIPSSKGPYLSVFRRSVKFAKSTGTRLRDVKGYEAFLKLLTHLESTSEQFELLELLSY